MDEDGKVIDFEVPAFDVTTEFLIFDIIMDADTYSADNALFILPANAEGPTKMVIDLDSDNLEVVAVIPPSELTYTVTITDMEAGTGEIVFSLPVDMEWLEDNFNDFFSMVLVSDEGDTESDFDDFEATKFHEDGLQVDISVGTYEDESNTLKMSIVMAAEDYEDLFVSSATDATFVLGNVSFSVIEP